MADSSGAGDLKSAVRGLGTGSPLGQITSGLDRAGAAVQDGYASAKKRLGGVVDQVRGVAGKAGVTQSPDPRPHGKLIGDIKLPPMTRKPTGRAYSKGPSMSKGR